MKGCLLAQPIYPRFRSELKVIFNFFVINGSKVNSQKSSSGRLFNDRSI